uniref:Uncharacterized protein n=1 Tax=Arundo donax TaxID=35708 RepID=A0A0A9EQ47_ARUDO
MSNNAITGYIFPLRVAFSYLTTELNINICSLPKSSMLLPRLR